MQSSANYLLVEPPHNLARGSTVYQEEPQHSKLPKMQDLHKRPVKPRVRERKTQMDSAIRHNLQKTVSARMEPYLSSVRNHAHHGSPYMTRDISRRFR